MKRIVSVGDVAVSVVIPCYNERLGLPHLISNVQWLVTELPNWEFILVDNGSTDDSLAVINELISGESRIMVIRVEENIGYGHGITSGLSLARGSVVGWFHADLQVAPHDIVAAARTNKIADRHDTFFLKGLRSNRSAIDVAFTVGMSCFESVLFKSLLWDINAQPTFFHRRLFESWDRPPDDFSLDLYAYVIAKRFNSVLIRHPITQVQRQFGESSWNSGFIARIRLMLRTIRYSFKLYGDIK